MMYDDECYALCDLVVLSVVEVCVDYGGVNVFHVFLIVVSSMESGPAS